MGLCSDEFEFSIITRLVCWLFGNCWVWICLLLGLVVVGGFWGLVFTFCLCCGFDCVCYGLFMMTVVCFVFIVFGYLWCWLVVGCFVVFVFAGWC